MLADTGPLYAALDPDDQHHVQAQEDTRRLAGARLGVVVLYPTLLEGYSLAVYRLGIQVAHVWLAEVSAGTLLLNPSTEDYQQAQELLLTFRDQPLTLFDSILAVTSRRLRAPVWTYDHHFDVMRVEVWRDGAGSG